MLQINLSSLGSTTKYLPIIIIETSEAKLLYINNISVT